MKWLTSRKYFKKSHSVFIKHLLFICLIIFITGSMPIIGAAEGDCISCHTVRHGQQNETYCINCHEVYDSKNHTDIDGSELPYPYFVHTGFDWKDDGTGILANMNDQEGCAACHKGIKQMSSDLEYIRTCEDCHIEGGRGPVYESTGFKARSDIDILLPKIESHYAGSLTVNVSDQSKTFSGDTKSSCFGYNTETGEGTCHGTTEYLKDKSGGYFAHTNLSRPDSIYNRYFRPSDPYQRDLTIDNMPDSTDCVFCHLQEDRTIAYAWGNASLSDIDSHIDISSNTECWDCHTLSSQKPSSFHSGEVVLHKPKNWSILVIVASIFAICIGLVYLYKKKI